MSNFLRKQLELLQKSCKFAVLLHETHFIVKTALLTFIFIIIQNFNFYKLSFYNFSLEAFLLSVSAFLPQAVLLLIITEKSGLKGMKFS